MAKLNARGLGRLARFWRTVQHLAPAQILSRVRVRLLRCWWQGRNWHLAGGRPVVLSASGAFRRPARGVEEAARDAARKAVERIAGNSFEFLRRHHRFRAGIAWQAPEQTQLWRFHLHYFGYVRELVLADSAGGNAGFLQFRRLAEAWIAGNNRIAGDGWHPYTLSLRIINWLKAVHFWRAEAESEGKWLQGVRVSIESQARLLEAQLEYDVRGNHLLENGRALVWLGLLTDDPASAGRLERGWAILAAELREQILSDGCHFERCPGYHFSLLLSLVELCCLCEVCGHERPAVLTGAVDKMARWGRNLLLPDGRIPRLKDSSYDQLPVGPGLILAAATHVVGPLRNLERLRRILFFGPELEAAVPAMLAADDHKGGYLAARRNGEMLIFDVGPPCPSYLPAHAHADALSYEFFADGMPIVTDAGVYDYAPGPWRDYFRSTAAHSTVSIDGKNSSEVWGSFRVGRRANVQLLRREVEADRCLYEGEHDGFAYLPGAPRHRRSTIWRPGEWLAVVDVVEGVGEHLVENFVHFHPRLRPENVEMVPGGGSRVALLPSRWFLVSAMTGRSEIVRGREAESPQGWYSAEFGHREPASVVRFAVNARLPFASAYALTADPSLKIGLEPAATGWRLQIHSGGKSWQQVIEARCMRDP